jgi:hypothetical protein
VDVSTARRAPIANAVRVLVPVLVSSYVYHQNEFNSLFVWMGLPALVRPF